MPCGRRRWSVSVPDYELLVFDWDGTLVDSVARIVESVRVAADVCGLQQLDEAPIRGIIGLGLPEAIATLYPESADGQMIERFRTIYAEHYVALEAEPTALFPGVADGLEALRVAGYRLAVATGKSRRGLQRVLAGRGWDNYFEITRCADETASKPDPLMLREILEYCSVSPQRALMIGDSSFDLQMARHAGMDSVAVGYGAQSLQCLQAFEPRWAIMSFAELLDWLLPVGPALTEVGVYGG
jgi:phosphoglycolate phosphatase